MKRILVLTLLTGFVVSCIAQTARFGIFAGPQMTSSKYIISGGNQPTSYKIGFHAGVGWKIPFENKLYFSPEIFYSLKGYKVKLNRPAFPPATDAVDNNTSIHTVELAFLLQYDFSEKANHFFLKLGPSLDFQLFGKEKFRRMDNSVTDRNMVFSFGDYGHYGASVLVHLGYEIANGFVIAGRYSYGIGSINNADNGPSITHRVFGISVGKYLK